MAITASLQPASDRIQLPASDSVPFFQRRPGSHNANQPGSGLVLADYVRFGQDGSGPEASRCARIIGPICFGFLV